MIIMRIICLIMFLFGILIAMINSFLSRRNNNKPIKRKDGHNFCVLVPARYESNVIEELLISIKKQTFKINMKDVYVIVESKEDETVNICKKYDVTVVIRKHLELQRKGYALDEGVKYILSKNKKYDAYFIFDADNILDKDYMKNMISIFDRGYDLASGYRNCKNGNKSVIASSSALTFSLVNTVFNNRKNKETRNITFSGTGFYIRGYLIDKWKGYPFHSLTEDYEISCYATLNNLTTYYNTNSVFYDEQPFKYKDTINQRQRWIRGYFDVRRMYSKKMIKSLNIKDNNFGSKLDEAIGIIPYVFMVISLVLYFLFNICIIMYNLINKLSIRNNLIELLMFFIGVYIALFIMTLVIILLEGNKIDLNNKIKIKTLFYNPIFMMSYVLCAIKAFTKKEVKWTKVKHGK